MSAWEARRVSEEEGRGTRSSLTTAWHEIFAASNFCDFAIFPAIRKKQLPQIKITANKQKVHSSGNILQLKFATQKYSNKKSCLFNHNLSLSFRHKGVYIHTLFDGLAYNTCGYFASCVVFSEPRRGEEKYEQ